MEREKCVSVIVIDKSKYSLGALADSINNTLFKNLYEISISEDRQYDYLFNVILFGEGAELLFDSYVDGSAIKDLKISFSGEQEADSLVNLLIKIRKPKDKGGLREVKDDGSYPDENFLFLANRINFSMLSLDKYRGLRNKLIRTSFSDKSSNDPISLGELINYADALLDSGSIEGFIKSTLKYNCYIHNDNPMERVTDRVNNKMDAILDFKYKGNKGIDNKYLFQENVNFKYKHLKQLFLIIDESSYTNEELLDNARIFILNILKANNMDDPFELIPIRFSSSLINPYNSLDELKNISITKLKHEGKQNLECLISYLEDILDYSSPKCLIRDTKYAPNVLLVSNRLDWKEDLINRYNELLKKHYHLNINILCDLKYANLSSLYMFIKDDIKLYDIERDSGFSNMKYYQHIPYLEARDKVRIYDISLSYMVPFMKEYHHVPYSKDNRLECSKSRYLVYEDDINKTIRNRFDYECRSQLFVLILPNGIEGEEYNKYKRIEDELISICRYYKDDTYPEPEFIYLESDYKKAFDELNEILARRINGGSILDNSVNRPIVAIYDDLNYPYDKDYLDKLKSNKYFNNALRAAFTDNSSSLAIKEFVSSPSFIFSKDSFSSNIEGILKISLSKAYDSFINNHDEEALASYINEIIKEENDIYSSLSEELEGDTSNGRPIEIADEEDYFD